MKFKVVYRFKDLETGHIYNVGDTFPHVGKVKKSRIDELSTENNKLRKVLIVKVDDDSNQKETELETVELVTNTEVKEVDIENKEE